MIRKKSQALLFSIILSVIVVVSTVSQATADTLILRPDVEFSESAPPVNTPPWMTATFNSSDSNTVRLTMSADNLTGTEFISKWFFNFSGDAGSLGFAYVSGTGPASSTISNVETNNKADGDGYYDIGFYFPTADGSRFNAGETVVYDITSTSSITASSFNSVSAPGGGNGEYLTAAHVQGINDNESGWVGTSTVAPEPVSSSLFIAGAATLGFRRFRKIRKG